MPECHFPASGDVVSVALARHLLDLMTWQGLPPEPILAAAGLSTDRLGQLNDWLPVAQGAAMMHAALALNSDPLFYLKLSQLTFLSGYGIVGYLLESSPTLKDAIAALLRYERLLSSMAYSRLDRQPGKVLWGFECRSDDAVLVRHMTEFHIGGRYQFLLMVKEKRSSMVAAVHFRHAAPPGLDAAAEYGKVFRCPVRFEQPESALVLHPQALGLPLRQVEAGLRETLEAHADRKLNAMLAATSLVSQARTQLQMLLHTGHPTRERLAERLGISSRHLCRQLQQEGSGYRTLLDTLRLEMAHAQLRTTARTLDDIAQTLSFRDAQSFIRWFRQLTAMTPGEFRTRSP